MALRPGLPGQLSGPLSGQRADQLSGQLTGVFITGTDTEVGKTWVGSQLAAYLHQQGVRVSPRKPIESGCTEQDGQRIPSDGMAYYRAIEQVEPLEQICSIRLKAAISPARAAQLEGRDIRLENLQLACATPEGHTPIVEGAGGFYSPLCQNALNADLAHALALPVILVAEDKLGCLNHILLTKEAIEQRDLSLAAIVLNTIRSSELPMDNRNELEAHLDAPIICTHENNWLEQLVDSLGN